MHWLSLACGTVFLLPSCAQVTIKDEEICADFGADGASCLHTLTTDKRDVEKIQWDAERFGEICVKAEAISDWKSELEELCSISGRCTTEQKEALKSFFIRFKSLNAGVLK